MLAMTEPRRSRTYSDETGGDALPGDVCHKDVRYEFEDADAAIRDLEFAVIDFETTGSSPSRGDRAVEVGVVRVAGDGREVARYETLIQPDRSPGPTFVHKITASMLADAPRFADIAGDLSAVLDGAVLVAHNAAFDTRFLIAEFFRAGHVPPDVRRLCTVQLMRRGRPGLSSYRLTNCCRAAGVSLENHHTALDDAAATAEVLAYAFAGHAEQGRHYLSEMRPKGRSTAWPKLPTDGPRWTRADYAQLSEPTLFPM